MIQNHHGCPIRVSSGHRAARLLASAYERKADLEVRCELLNLIGRGKELVVTAPEDAYIRTATAQQLR